jgi:hypothetical protein
MKFSVKIMLLEATNTTLDFFLLTPRMKMEQTECSETSAHKIQMPGNHPKERIQHWTYRNRLELAWQCWAVLL